VDQRRYLYHARIASRLSLQQIGIRTALSPSVLRNLDEGRFELLPSGVYARSYVRTFAAAVGLDPEAALAELEHLLPGAPDPVPALNARRRGAEWPVHLALQLRGAAVQALQNTNASIAIRLARTTEQVNGAVRQAGPWIHSKLGRVRRSVELRRDTPSFERVGLWLRPWKEASAVVVARIRTFSENDLTDRLVARAGLLVGRMTSAAAEETTRHPITRLRNWPGLTRFGAAAIDALLLMIVDAFLVYLISWSSGIPAHLLLRDAGAALGAFCAIPIALYFLLFGGIAGSTLGGYVCNLLPSLSPAASGDRPHDPLTLHDILRRAVRR